MSKNYARHGTFSLEREYAATPAALFQVFSDPSIKARWFSGPEGAWSPVSASMDFREGGYEHNEGVLDNGVTTRFDSTYHEIVEDRRLVYVYEMRINSARISISLATIEFEASENGARLRVTEQGVFFDEHDDGAMREEGTRLLLDQIGRLFPS